MTDRKWYEDLKGEMQNKIREFEAKVLYKAIVSGHIFLNEKGFEDIEILSQIDDDDYTEAFDDIDHALLDEIDIGGSKDYYFIAVVKSRFTKTETHEGIDYDVEHEVHEIKDVNDLDLLIA